MSMSNVYSQNLCYTVLNRVTTLAEGLNGRVVSLHSS